MASLRDDLIAAFEAYARRPKPRHRPRADTLADLDTGMRRVAIEVFMVERALGRRRGDLTKAIAEVVKRYARERKGSLSEENVRRAVHRYRDLRAFVDELAKLEQDRKILAKLERQEEEWVELRRRMRGFPDDVTRYFGPFLARDVLALLRAEGIDGECPRWFAEGVRRRIPT